MAGSQVTLFGLDWGFGGHTQTTNNAVEESSENLESGRGGEFVLFVALSVKDMDSRHTSPPSPSRYGSCRQSQLMTMWSS